jgi:uncharacterized membrane protein
MNFNFSIRAAFKDSWKLFAKHALFFTTLSFVMIVFSLFYNSHHEGTTSDTILTIVVVIAMILWGYVWISAALAAVDGKEKLLTLRSLSVHMPTLRQFFMMALVALVVGVIVGIGFVLLIVPGVYFMMRLAFATTSYVDRQGSLKQTLSYSWHLVKGKIFWTVFLVFIIELVLVFIGSLTLMIGSLVTYPLAILLMTHLYRALTKHALQVQKHHEQ